MAGAGTKTEGERKRDLETEREERGKRGEGRERKRVGEMARVLNVTICQALFSIVHLHNHVDLFYVG